MINRIPKKYRQKYAKPKSWDAEVMTYAFKIIGPIALFFIAAIGFDIYSLIR